ncbi:hypothetical protein LCGC14_1756980 [marine sediment metagenome]|uniref:Calcineurin-like phosphoesterase domain-containing protein n=1 Tax=marine sediment metagenome TaxID=412755 RepID=A0A0F9JHA7_9ZZZZ
MWTGDVFHVKRPSFVSHALMQRLIDLFGEWPGRRLVILGNHDMGPAGVESVSRQPIGVLLRAGVLELMTEDLALTVDDRCVQLSPVHYADDAVPEHYTLRRMKGVDLAIVVAHGAIMPPKQSPPFDHVSASDIDTTGCDLLCYGHIHEDHGVYKVGSCRFVNFGSLGRVARTGYNRRDVSVAVVSGDGTVTKVRLDTALPADEVFITVEGEEDAEDGDLKAYARELVYALQRGSSTSIEDLLAEVSEGVGKNVKAGVVQYLNEAGL